MALRNGSVNFSSSELLEAHTHVWNQIFNFINSMSLKCAIQLGIPDIIHKHGKPIKLSELVNSLPINKAKSHDIHRLMRILIHSKFFVRMKISQEDEESGYWLTPASRLLLNNEPCNIAPFALAMLDPILTDPWHQLEKWFQNNSPSPFEMTHGKHFWEHTEHEPRLNDFFNKGMASDAELISRVLVNDCKEVFEGLDSMIDVAGGTGTVAYALTGAHPGLKCIVLELPHVIEGLVGSENLRFLGGDMFKCIPQADAVFLKWILHDWSDEDCMKILKNCKKAISSNVGKLIVVEMVVNSDESKEKHEVIENQLFFDMMMMTLVDGKERTEKEWAKLFYDAGFTSYKITPVLGMRSLIEVFP